MEFLQLKYFCDAAETQNFSKTAKKYLVPTSNISQSVKRLERELGCDLFEHRANRIALNEDGKRFYASVSQALAILEGAKAQLSDRGGELCGDIRLVCLNNRRTVTAAIEAFLQKHPNVNFIIHHTADAEREFDLFISDVCPYEYSQKRLLVDDEICVALRRDHRLAGKERVTVADLERERFITMTSGNSLQKITVNACADAGFAPNIAIQTDDPFYLRKYIQMGLGIALVPANSWSGLFPEEVVLKPLNGIRRKTYAYIPKGRYVKQPVSAFLHVLCGEQTP